MDREIERMVMHIEQLLLFTIILFSSFTAKALDFTTNPDLNELIGDTKPISFSACGFESDEICEDEKKYSFEVDYGSKGKIKGQGLCSTHMGTDLAPTDSRSYRITEGNIFSELSDETGKKGAEYCYCRLNGYIAPSGILKKLQAPLILASYGGAFLEDGAEDACADHCTTYCLRELLHNYGFRSALFMLDNINDWIKCDYESDDNKSNVFNLNTKICKTAGIEYGFTSKNGELYSGATELGLTKNDKNAFAIDYGSKGILRGVSKCSNQQDTNTKEKIPDKTGQYCYCQLSSYTPRNGPVQPLSSEWIVNDINNDPNTYVSCDYGCAPGCATILRNNDPASIVFRFTMFSSLNDKSNKSITKLDLNKIIGDTKGIKYELNNKDKFVVDYGNKGKIQGYGRCSNKSGILATDTNNCLDVTTTSGPSLTSADGQNQYCWCTIDGYAPHGKEISPFSAENDVWVFLNDYVDIDTCAENCTTGCAKTLQNNDDLVFRSAAFNSQVIHLKKCETK